MSGGTVSKAAGGSSPDTTDGKQPGVLLDRDGTIIVDDGYVGSVDRVRLIEGAAEAIAQLNAAGLPVAVVTNQAGVARGYYGIEDVHAVHRHLDALLAEVGAHVDAWLFCPYHPDGVVEGFARASADRKPGPGMAWSAADTLGLDLTRSWVVGDADCDMGLARAIGAQGIKLGDPAQTPVGPAVVTAPDLASAVALILAAEQVAPPVAAPVDSVFPTRAYEDAGLFGTDYGAELFKAMQTVDPAQLSAAAKLINEAHDRDATVFACGNGGSASIANHLQCDHVKGVGTGTDVRARVFSLSTNIELFSAIGNDLGYEQTFEHQLACVARPGDLLIAVSSSGRSPNVIRALEWAKAHDMGTIAFTGFGGGGARDLADVAVHVDSRNYGVVEDAHAACMHLLAQYVRQSRMSAEAIALTTF